IVSRSLNVPFCLAFHYYLHNLILHSFPTRRSSDLDIQFLSALLFKDAYKNINNFVYGAVNLSKQDITEAKLLYQLFTIESRVERVFTLLDIPYEKLERMSFTMEALGDTEISGDSQKSLSKNIESEIARFVDAKGEDFFRNNNQLLTDMLISMI